MKYEVVVTRIGSLFIEADTPEKAMEIANNQSTEDVHWADDWDITDCTEDEFPEKHNCIGIKE